MQMAPSSTNKDVGVLVVEDEDALRDLTVEILKRAGYRVYSAAGGIEALEVLKTKKEIINLVLSDIRMPAGDGMFLLDSIRAKDPKNPKVILLTGFSDISIETCLSHGAQQVLQKPCPRPKLLEAIDRVVSAS